MAYSFLVSSAPSPSEGILSRSSGSRRARVEGVREPPLPELVTHNFRRARRQCKTFELLRDFLLPLFLYSSDKIVGACIGTCIRLLQSREFPEATKTFSLYDGRKRGGASHAEIRQVLLRRDDEFRRRSMHPIDTAAGPKLPRQNLSGLRFSSCFAEEERIFDFAPKKTSFCF